MPNFTQKSVEAGLELAKLKKQVKNTIIGSPFKATL